jgi:hypothetical protein
MTIAHDESAIALAELEARSARDDRKTSEARIREASQHPQLTRNENMHLNTNTTDPTDPPLEMTDPFKPREIIAGETLFVQPVGAVLDRIEILDIDLDAAPSIDGGAIRFVADCPGHARFRVHTTDANHVELRVLACEPTCLDYITRHRAARPPQPGAIPERLVVRSMVVGALRGFTGRAEQLVGRGELAQFGA